MSKDMLLFRSFGLVTSLVAAERGMLHQDWVTAAVGVVATAVTVFTMRMAVMTEARHTVVDRDLAQG